VGFFFGHVEDFHVYFHVGVEVAAEAAVWAFEAAVRQFVGAETAGEADFVVNREQSGTLKIGTRKLHS
jgi:hypothetical protein